MLECWWTLIFAQLSIQYCLNRRNKLIFLEKRLSLLTTQARFLIGPLYWPLIGPPIWAQFWKRFQAWYREVLLRQVTDGVVYSSNRDSFVNWDMTLGTKWTAEEYTNSQGTVITSLSHRWPPWTHIKDIAKDHSLCLVRSSTRLVILDYFHFTPLVLIGKKYFFFLKLEARLKKGWSLSIPLTWISRIESTSRTFGTIWNSIHSRSSFYSNWISDSRNSYDC